MKLRLFAAAAAVITALRWIPPIPANAAKLCGKQITWDYDADTKTLTLTGEGEMFDYNSILNTVTGIPAEEGLYNNPWWDDYLDTEHIVIGDGITSIGANAFFHFNNVKEVTVPDSVTRIGEFAFGEMQSLQSVTLSKNLRVLENDVFNSADNLTEITLPDGLAYIGARCFLNTHVLAALDVPDSVEYIGQNGLTNCTEWNQAQAAKSDFLIVGDGILYQYYGRTAAEISVPDGVKTVCSSAFGVPMEAPHGSMTYTFTAPQLSPLQSISLPDSVQTIGEYAFSQLQQLERVRLPESLARIEKGLFAECPRLAAVDIPKTVQTIGEKAFYRCSALAELNIPETVREVGSDALYGTSWLDAQQNYVILGGEFLYCYRGHDKILTIPENVSTIYSYALNNQSILEVHIPSTVKTIRKNAVQCPNAVIFGEKGSAAERFAAENGMPFQDIRTPQPSGRDMTLDLTRDVWAFGNTGKVFGETYFLSTEDKQALQEHGVSMDNIEGKWDGSCVGLSISVILAKCGLIAPELLTDGANSLRDVQPDKTVQSLINYYQCTQGRAAGAVSSETALLRFYRMICSAKNIPHGEPPLLIVFALESGSHGVVGYGQENGAWTFDGKAYDRRILIWDSNYPDGLHEDSCIYYDSRTLDYCIPQYGVHIAEGAADNTAGIITVCNDVSILNACPHPLTAVHGDINRDGQLTVSDAILLARICAEDTAVLTQNAEPQDMDGDGFITVTDVTEILKMLANTQA